ncbi:MAG: NAD(P)/FAD-dependent oxidoreductase [Nitrospirae bacterium]|nr:NAD(P)/FAD-dependent oxidoreductase [Nitrospirota bacterium]
MTEKPIYDCIIIGAGPGGLQAAIYLGRFNRRVLVIDRGAGRTTHARHIENYLAQKGISGTDIIRIGMEQARSFGVDVIKGEVVSVLKDKDIFTVSTATDTYAGRYIVVSTGGKENIPEIENIHKFFARTVVTCIDCDGYHFTGRKTVVIGNSIKSADLAMGMREMYSKDMTLILCTDKLPPDYKEELKDEGIRLVIGRPKRFHGADAGEAVEMEDGTMIPCEMVMSHFGFKLNDQFLSGLNLKKESDGRTYQVNRDFESSLRGLYIVGPLCGHDQVVIAAGEGAIAALDIKKQLLEM